MLQGVAGRRPNLLHDTEALLYNITWG